MIDPTACGRNGNLISVISAGRAASVRTAA